MAGPTQVGITPVNGPTPMLLLAVLIGVSDLIKGMQLNVVGRVWKELQREGCGYGQDTVYLYEILKEFI